MNRFRIGCSASVVCLFFVATAGAQANPGGAAGSCDKASLRSLADAYFAALVAHDPRKASMAPNAKFTENAQAVNIGDGDLATPPPHNYSGDGGMNSGIPGAGNSYPRPRNSHAADSNIAGAKRERVQTSVFGHSPIALSHFVHSM